MNKYIKEIINLIDEQLKNSSDECLIRLEGFENPDIYYNICTYFSNMEDVKLLWKI